ncbi:iron-siderophore ABC transporter substrate-binding protein [Paenibacillus sambharensis]|uniref:Iron-siderophore ABC transporter substrate-binding protein n=1 Tax=Paenibacillus sambharensis TaxID=1803190 RepID=A0A2W1LGI4_9BACL|nr:iron-siderophore ABC transporter substrate-binding protein [Paenibacillus sambharensis]PZD97789.1 iron-siderophore ABC transporter substrate-binding protein [Paenibacillus sambharensis]
MYIRKQTWSIGLIVMMLVLAACGGNNAVNNGTPNSGNAGNAGGQNEAVQEPVENNTQAGKEGPITINTVKGEVKLDKPAERVVSLEWTYTEDLLAVGVQPVGHADIEGYKNWYDIPQELSADVTDVGTRQEPNLELITSLAPDLIIVPDFRSAANYEQLAAIAPTIVFGPYPAEDAGYDQYGEMESTFREIAKAVGKEAEAEEVLASMHESFAAAADKIKAAGKEGHKVVLTQAWSTNNVPEFRLFTDNSLAAQILEKIGLENAWESDKFEVYGFSTNSVEALSKIEDASLLHMVQDEDNIFENQLKDNAVWNAYPFVKEGRVYALGGDTWPFGGPLAAEVFATKTADLLSQ